MEEQNDDPAQSDKGLEHSAENDKDTGEVAAAVEVEQSLLGKELPITHLPTPSHSDMGLQGTMSTSALNVVWSFGVSKVPVLNLTDGYRQAVMYTCSHMGVMYDYQNNRQYILQGHLNCITCSYLSKDKHWLVTGDKGPNATIIAWDTYTGVPIQTLFDPNPDGGFEAVALSTSGSCMATLSGGFPQILAVWNWTVDGDTPMCSVEVKADYGLQNHLRFSADDDHYIVSTGLNQDKKSIKYYAPSLAEEGFVKPVGQFTQSLFQDDSAHVLTATAAGYLVVWDNNCLMAKDDNKIQMADKKVVKIINLHCGGINVLTVFDQYVVVADHGGHITFYDQELLVVHWFKIGLGTITSLSFSIERETKKEDGKVGLGGKQKKVTAFEMSRSGLDAFVVRDFIVATPDNLIASVTNNGKNIKILQREPNNAVHALSVHPSQPLVAIGSHTNMLKVWNYESKEVIVSRTLEQNGSLHTCAYDPRGIYIVVGMTTGVLCILDALTLQEEPDQSFHEVHCPITRIIFSHDSCFIATSDAEYATSLFKAEAGELGWGPYQYLGRYKAHFKPICDMLFGLKADSNKPRLLSLGSDRHLVEYDLENSKKDNLVVVSWDRIEQSAVPCCMTWYPPLSLERFLITANDQFKLKLYNATTRMCRKTLLGPTFGTPLKKLMVVPKQGDDSRCYGAYITEDKVGLIIFPLDGNPHNGMGLIAHPFGVSRLEVSHDGRYLFTAGGTDRTVHMWEINIKRWMLPDLPVCSRKLPEIVFQMMSSLVIASRASALEAQSRLGGEGLVPFYGLLDGGRDGKLFAQLEDFFYYAQLRRQGHDAMEKRVASTTIPVSEISYIMRAMGFFPSEQEIEDMINEVKFSRYVETGRYVQEVDLGAFIKLYVNHRPAFGLSVDKVKWAFDILGVASPAGSSLAREELLDLLQSKGEHMTEYELAECLATLLGLQPEGGTSEGNPFNPEEAATLIDQGVPAQVNASNFTRDILGFGSKQDPTTAPSPELP